MSRRFRLEACLHKRGRGKKKDTGAEDEATTQLTTEQQQVRREKKEVHTNLCRDQPAEMAGSTKKLTNTQRNVSSTRGVNVKERKKKQKRQRNKGKGEVGDH